MRKELDEALCRDFPDLYAQRHDDMRHTAMCWGFQCGDGWEPLIRKLSENLTKLAKWEDAEVVVSTVKEKYGTLSFYVWSGTDIMYDVIHGAENRSGSICEECGAYGRVRSRGNWLACRCAPCAHAEGYPLYDFEAEKLGVTEYRKEEET